VNTGQQREDGEERSSQIGQEDREDEDSVAEVNSAGREVGAGRVGSARSGKEEGMFSFLVFFYIYCVGISIS
jgi:hypothetical protein